MGIFIFCKLKIVQFTYIKVTLRPQISYKVENHYWYVCQVTLALCKECMNHCWGSDFVIIYTPWNSRLSRATFYRCPLLLRLAWRAVLRTSRVIGFLYQTVIQHIHVLARSIPSTPCVRMCPPPNPPPAYVTWSCGIYRVGAKGWWGRGGHRWT